MIDTKKLLDDLYVIRTVVMVETNPQSNEYLQIMITHETMVNMLDVLEVGFKKEANGSMRIVTKDEKIQISDTKDSFTQEEIEAGAQ